jgi:hypothetical protein
MSPHRICSPAGKPNGLEVREMFDTCWQSAGMTEPIVTVARSKCVLLTWLLCRFASSSLSLLEMGCLRLLSDSLSSWRGSNLVSLGIWSVGFVAALIWVWCLVTGSTRLSPSKSHVERLLFYGCMIIIFPQQWWFHLWGMQEVRASVANIHIATSFKCVLLAWLQCCVISSPISSLEMVSQALYTRPLSTSLHHLLLIGIVLLLLPFLCITNNIDIDTCTKTPSDLLYSHVAALIWTWCLTTSFIHSVPPIYCTRFVDYVYIRFVYLVDFLTSQPKYPIFLVFWIELSRSLISSSSSRTLIFIYPGFKLSCYTYSQPYWWISLVGGSFMGNFRTVTLVPTTSAQLVPTSSHIWKCINRRFYVSFW